MKTRAHVFVTGKVHGVFFRVETKRNADYHDVKGWVRNLPDGRVEAVFEGEKETVEKIVSFCKHGPEHAEVTGTDVTWETYTGESDRFKIRYG
jgi:acylphosphatase